MSKGNTEPLLNLPVWLLKRAGVHVSADVSQLLRWLWFMFLLFILIGVLFAFEDPAQTVPPILGEIKQMIGW